MGGTSIRQKISGVLEDSDARGFPAANYVISAVTLVSVCAIILESVSALEGYRKILLGVEYASVAFFTAEYILRIFSAERPIRYMVSFFGIIDLVSILPVYILPIGANMFQAKNHAVRMARFLRILRLIKIVRHHSMRLHTKMHGRGRHIYLHLVTIEIYVLAVSTSILILASALYAFEGSQSGFANIPRSILWIGETIFGGSISSNLPATVGGRIIAIMTRFTGLILFGLLVAVMGRVVNRLLFGVEDLADDERKG